jgi:hypothetical protein
LSTAEKASGIHGNGGRQLTKERTLRDFRLRSKIHSLEPSKSKMGEVELEERTLRRELNSSLSKLQRGPDIHSNGGGQRTVMVKMKFLNLGHLERNTKVWERR